MWKCPSLHWGTASPRIRPSISLFKVPVRFHLGNGPSLEESTETGSFDIQRGPQFVEFAFEIINGG